MLVNTPERSCMRLVWYVAGTLNAAGGIERLLMEGLLDFQRKGITATLLLDSAMPDGAALFEGIYSPNISLVDSADRPAPNDRKPYWRVARHLRLVQKLARCLRLLKPDILIANDANACRRLLEAAMVGRVSLPPCLTFVHGSFFQFPEDKDKYALVFMRFRERIRRGDSTYSELIAATAPSMPIATRFKVEIRALLNYISIRRSKAVVVLSQKNAAEVRCLYNTDKVRVVPYGAFSLAAVPRRQNQIATDEACEKTWTILSIARLVPKKRIEILIRALEVLCQQPGAGAYLLIIGGTGPDEERLRSVAIGYGVEHLVRFIGYVPERELLTCYSTCDIFVSPDNADYDLSPMQALSQGRRIVVSEQFDFPASFNKVKRRIFTAPPTAVGYAEAIRRARAADVGALTEEEYDELSPLSSEVYFSKLLDLATN